MAANNNQRVTIPALQSKKENKEKITALTAYDFPIARIVDDAGIDLVLVGDSLGMVVLGYDNTMPVTMDEMIHHTKPVVRAVKRALVIGDMPYFSFHLSTEESVFNASRFIKEAGAQGVKIEGASKKRLKLIESLVEAEIPVMGHVGLTPQSIHHIGQFKVKGSEKGEARKVIQDAVNLEKAGVFAVILECIPMELAGIITEKLKVPTIGIGAGPRCDGQILVFHDLVGYSSGYLPKFVKKYADLHGIISQAVGKYKEDVQKGVFPDDEHSYHLKPEAARLLKKIRKA
ncbi:MAG: 3-methyl-2-oxobutanoate hydroxymethyltransferase [Candidatus Aminicenantes bacterium]|nr:3-methyl-2-oxobutanoate hydroxymethyltransferase [Candidatus Aminicenantes bacterium]